MDQKQIVIGMGIVIGLVLMINATLASTGKTIIKTTPSSKIEVVK